MNEVGNNLSLEDLIGELAEEFSQRVRRGESPRVEEYAQRYPDVAENIRRILPALALVVDDDPTIDHSAEGDDKPIPVPQNGILGDYRLRQEIGRGGMGVVYEAEQISLGRRVALKILPFAAVLDQRQIQRFKNEAIAAGQLDHPNIVDVYGVGCERSVHFYAMRCVEGDPLSQVIAQLKQAGLNRDSSSESDRGDDRATLPHGETTPLAALSTKRTATDREFFRSAARIGVQIAEALDHAHQQGVIHRDIKPANIIIDREGKPWVTDFGLARLDTGTVMTMTGDLLGTLRYMSPEQSKAKRVVVDHRTDIYSLGATLYELLTLRPVFTDEDRHELLRKISFESPTCLRKINRSIPEELEIIILKSLSKSASDRYETAQDLANDLQRFLDHKPILARRPGPIQICSQWTRRHSTLVAATMGVLLMITIGMTIASLLIMREQGNTASALSKSRHQAQRARISADLAHQALDEIYLQLADDRFTVDHQLTSKDQEFLHRAAAFYERVAEQKQNQADVAADVADAHYKIGSIYKRLSLYEEARRAFEQGIAKYTELASSSAGDVELQMKRVEGLVNLADVQQSLSEHQSSLMTCSEAIQQLESVPERNNSPSSKGRLLSSCYARRGQALAKLNDLGQARQSIQQAVDIDRALLLDNPDNIVARRELAIHLRILADVTNPSREDELADQIYVESMAELDTLSALASDNPAEVRFVAIQLAKEVDRLQDVNELNMAIETHRECISQWRRMVRTRPASRSYREELADALQSCCAKLTRAKRAEEAEKSLDEADRIVTSLLDYWPDSTRSAHLRRMIWMRRAQLASRTDQTDQVLAIYQTVIDSATEDRDVGMVSWPLLNLARLLEQQGKLDLAKTAYDRLAAIADVFPDESLSPDACRKIVVAQMRVGDWSGVIETCDCAIESSESDPFFYRSRAQARRLLSDNEALDIFTSESVTDHKHWKPIEDRRLAPVGTRIIRIRLIAQRMQGSNNDGYFDDVTLRTGSSENLVVNPGNETEPVRGNLPGWSGDPWGQRSSNPEPHLGATYFFAPNQPFAELWQDIDVSQYADQIDTGTCEFFFQCFARSYKQSPSDYARAIVEYRTDAPDALDHHPILSDYLVAAKLDAGRNVDEFARWIRFRQQMIQQSPGRMPDDSVPFIKQVVAEIESRAESESDRQSWQQVLTQLYKSRGVLHYDQQRYAAAIRDFRQAVNIDRQDSNAWNWLGICYAVRKEYDSAHDCISTAIDLDPDEHVYVSNRGAVLNEQELWPDAVIDFEKSLQLEPTHERSWRRLATAHQGVGDWDSAIRDYSRLIELRPESVGYYEARARLYARQGKMELAIADIESCLEIREAAVEKDPNNPELLGFRGVAYFQNRRHREAVDDFTRALELDPGNLLYLENRAINQLKLENWDQAKADYQQVIGHENHYRPAYEPWYRLALLQAFTGDEAAYRETCQQMLDEFGTADATSRSIAVWSCCLLPDALDDYQRAVQVAQSLVDQAPEEPSTQRDLGVILFRTGRVSEALETLRQSLHLSNQQPSQGRDVTYLKYFFALACHQLGQDVKARQYLVQANELADQEINDQERPVFWNRKLTLELIRTQATRAIQPADGG